MAHATYKVGRGPPPSPERRQAALEDAMRDAAKEKLFRQRMAEDPAGLIRERVGSIAEYLKQKKF